jgi:hypothetical protein
VIPTFQILIIQDYDGKTLDKSEKKKKNPHFINIINSRT